MWCTRKLLLYSWSEHYLVRYDDELAPMSAGASRRGIQEQGRLCKDNMLLGHKDAEHKDSAWIARWKP